LTKITLSVSKAYKNGGKRNHKGKTPRHWKHYFIDLDDYKFKTEWVSSIKALILKHKVFKKRKFICPECGLIFQGLVKKDSDTCECPECET